jgi:hypothetical protein
MSNNFSSRRAWVPEGWSRQALANPIVVPWQFGSYEPAISTARCGRPFPNATFHTNHAAHYMISTARCGRPFPNVVAGDAHREGQAHFHSAVRQTVSKSHRIATWLASALRISTARCGRPFPNPAAANVVAYQALISTARCGRPFPNHAGFPRPENRGPIEAEPIPSGPASSPRISTA